MSKIPIEPDAADPDVNAEGQEAAQLEAKSETPREEVGPPAVATDAEPGALEEMFHGDGERLHWSTVWLPCFDAIMGLLFPLIIGILFAPLGMLLFGFAAFGLATAAQHVFRYLTFRYRITPQELVLNSGIVHRRERRIPFDRVQETKIHQGLLHRLLGLARLEITTAGSDSKEASLNVVTRETAETVKATIDGRERISTSEDAPSEPADYACKLSTRELALGGLTSTLVASIGAIIAAIIYFQMFVGIGSRWAGQFEDNVEGKIEERLPDEISDQWMDFESRVPDLGPLNFLVEFYLDETLAKSLSLAVLGLVGSVLAYIVRYHGYQLTRKEQRIATSYGLLSLHHGSFSRDRIQALKLEEGLLRRPLGLASIRVDSAGDRQEIDEAKNRDVLVPVASKETAHDVARQAIPGLEDLDPDWRSISRLAIMRGSRKGWLIVALAALQTYIAAGWYCLMWLPAFPIVYFLNERWYRNTGYWMGELHFLSRKGWLNRSTICLPIKNIQNVKVTQNYFDRRLELATLSIDTAGQSNTGGGPVIRHLPVERAREIQATLARRAGESEFTW